MCNKSSLHMCNKNPCECVIRAHYNSSLRYEAGISIKIDYHTVCSYLVYTHYATVRTAICIQRRQHTQPSADERLGLLRIQSMCICKQRLTVRSLIVRAVIGPAWLLSWRIKVILFKSQIMQVASADPDTINRYVLDTVRQTTPSV